MNEVIRQLHERKSVRVFADRPVLPEEKRAILEAAMAAPTAGNQQLYTILDITDPELKARLSETCDHQPFIAKAPVVLIFCADCQKWYDAYREAACAPRSPGAGDLMLAVEDAAIVAQNAVTAAQSLGIGSCYIGDIMENCEEHRRMLNLPEYVFPAVMLVLGYPTKQQMDRAKPKRCRLEDIVQENGYRRRQGDELRAMFSKEYRDGSFEKWCSAFCARKYQSDFAREMSRSVSVYLTAFGGAAPWRRSADVSRPVITARQQIETAGEKGRLNLPKTAVLFYMGHGLRHLAASRNLEKIADAFPRFLNACEIYRAGGVCLLDGGRGAPQAADTLETLAAYGVERVISVGMCGVFGEDLNPGDILIPSRAYVEEGTSLHYYEVIEYAEPDEELTEAARKAFPESRDLPIVTTDAVYRQTFEKERLWREKGCAGVEMESSALMSVGKALGVAVTVILAASDKHPAAPGASSWQWHMPRKTREWFAERCLDFALSLGGSEEGVSDQ